MEGADGQAGGAGKTSWRRCHGGRALEKVLSLSFGFALSRTFFCRTLPSHVSRKLRPELDAVMDPQVWTRPG